MSIDPLSITLFPTSALSGASERAGAGRWLDASRVQALLGRDDDRHRPRARHDPGRSPRGDLPPLVAAGLADVETTLGLEPLARLRADVLRDGESFEALLAGYRLGTALRQAGEESINLVLGPRLDAATDAADAAWIEGVESSGVLVCPRVTPGWLRSVVEGAPSRAWAHGLELVQLGADPGIGTSEGTASFEVDAALVESLRQDLSFEGVVVAPTLGEPEDLDTAIAAVRAGCDLLPIAADPPERWSETLAEALAEIPAERLVDAIERVDRLRGHWLT